MSEAYFRIRSVPVASPVRMPRHRPRCTARKFRSDQATSLLTLAALATCLWGLTLSFARVESDPFVSRNHREPWLRFADSTAGAWNDAGLNLEGKPMRTYHTGASWYGPRFHGRMTANGEVFNRYAMTLASRQIPLGARVRVVNAVTGHAVLARVNDRGPYGRPGYTVDLSQGVARKLGLERQGLGQVRVELLRVEPRRRRTRHRRAH